MRKKIISLVAVIAVLAGLTGLLYLLNQEPEAEEEEFVSDAVYMVGGGDDALTVSRVDISNENGEYAVVKTVDGEDGDFYFIEGMEDLELHQSNLRGVISGGSSVLVKKVISEEGGDPSIYGLDKPSAVIEITAGEGSPTVLLGDAAPGNDGFYAMVQGESAIYLLSASTVEKFQRSPLFYVSTTVSQGTYSEETGEYSEFERITLAGPVREEPVVVEPIPQSEEDGVGMSFSMQRIVEPFEADLDFSNALPKLMTVFALTADEVAAVHAGEEDLAAYGLDEPYSQAVVESRETGDFTLSASVPDEEGRVYMTSSAQPGIVYRVSASKAAWMDLQAFEMMSKMLYLPHIDSVSKITLEVPEKTYVFTLEGEGDDLAVEMNGQELDTKNFRQFYQTIIGASYQEYSNEQDLEDAPFLRYTYEYKERSGSDTLSFYTGPARRYYLSFNGGPAHLTQSMYVDFILSSLEKLEAGEEVTSYL